MKIKTMLYVLVGIILFLALSSVFGGFKAKLSESNPQEIGQADEISIVSFNVGYLSMKLFGIKLLEPATFIPQRLEKLPEAIINTNADIILLQEIYSEKYKKTLINKLEKTYPYAIYYKKALFFDFGMSNGLMIISKFPIVNHDFKQFKNITPHEKLLINKGYLYAEIKISDDKTISIINSHNSARGIFNGENAKYIVNLKSDQIKEIIEFADSKNIQFIGGDYNCGPCFFPEMYGIFKTLNFLEAFELKYPNQKFVTWDIENPLSQNDLFPDTPPQKDDHIFIKNNLAEKTDILNAEVIFDKKIVEINGENYPLSDHYGVLATFKFK
ncbi:MAG: endonuclease/exonuclease/phosphatase family protein [Bacteroidales bacterium]|nr:endonuclease/exonuclease/phosphatase family protein [Bacteroidales bacterium]